MEEIDDALLGDEFILIENEGESPVLFILHLIGDPIVLGHQSHGCESRISLTSSERLLTSAIRA